MSNPCDGFDDETLWVLAAVLNEKYRDDRAGWLDTARWLAKRFDLLSIEEAAKTAFDPPTGHIDLGSLGLLIYARALARAGIGESDEATSPEFVTPVPADLFLAVEDAFEGVEIPDS